MSPFSGFDAAAGKAVPIPSSFFTELLPEIGDLDELKVLLWAFQLLNLQENDPRYLTREDFFASEEFIHSLGRTKTEQMERLVKALESMQRRGVLLAVQNGDEELYFLNSPRGRAAIEGLKRGAWQPQAVGGRVFSAGRPNIFTLYEQNIGPLTPMIADELRDAETEYPADWIGDAFRIAVTHNARNWRYIHAILRSWKEKGRDERDQRTAQEDRKLDSEGPFGDYVHH